ncbi:MAG: hypothetical protein IT436_08580 [Phycisphaerales bacterium]|nr:hypothetical protein [Phycisphaerales bacterium]
MGRVNDEPIAAHVRFEIEGWIFAAAVTGEELAGFLSWLPEEQAAGNNLRMVWHERRPDGGWACAAWTDASLHDAVAWLRAQHADGMLLAEDPDVAMCIAPGVIGGDLVPAYLEHGLLVNDPLTLVVAGSASPENLVELLETMGWEVAPWISQLSVQTSGPCYGEGTDNALEGVLNGLLEESELDLFGQTTLTHSGCAWPCKCKTDYGESAATGTGAWTLTSSTTVGDRKTCRYSRPATRAFTKKGKYPILCGNCAATGTETGRQVGAEDVLASDPCPAGPSTWSFVPGE